MIINDFTLTHTADMEQWGSPLTPENNTQLWLLLAPQCSLVNFVTLEVIAGQVTNRVYLIFFSLSICLLLLLLKTKSVAVEMHGEKK